ncbi:OmpA family protein [Palleronia rufa]|uniref:OmpA family protein n=1 Tax=Palleronia rufa TaxID=1530186 RepID=UPI00056C3882|nr:OmpA family protein [Palleronia rufa]
MKSALKTTTAILASLNLAVPFPALAQDASQQSVQEMLGKVGQACSAGADSDGCQSAIAGATAAGVPQDAIDAVVPSAGADAAPAEAGESAPAPAPAPEATAPAPEAPDAGEAPAQTGSETPPEQPAAPAATEETAPPDASGAAEPAAPDSAAAPSAPEAGAAPAPGAETAAPDTSAETAAPDAGGQTAAPDTSGQTTAPDAGAEPAAPDASAATAAPDAGANTAAPDAGGQTAAPEASAETAAPDASGQTAASDTSGQTTTPDAGAEPAAPETAAPAAEPQAAPSAGDTAPAATGGAAADAEMPSADELEQSLGAAQEPAAGAETGSQTGAAPAETAAPGAGADSATQTAPAETGAAAPMTQTEAAAVEGQAPVAAAAAEDAEAVDTQTTTVTEETSRSSSEDFATSIQRSAEGAAGANAQQQTGQQQAGQEQTGQQQTGEADATAAANDDGGGLSNLEKGLLLGAGALAVGALIRGNRQVVASADDRVVVSRGDGSYELIKDDNALLRQPGAEVRNETFSDGSTRSTVSYEDGSQVVTIRDADLRVVRRVRITPDGTRVVLIDDIDQTYQPVDVAQLQQTEQTSRTVDLNDEAALRDALSANRQFDRAFSLSQVRNIPEVRYQVPAVDLEAITFDTGSAAIRPEQAQQLRALGQFIRDTIAQEPRAVFLVEGHTDAVGDAAYNLALSDRRAESVALALSEYFQVPASNMVVQGYGERFLKVPTEADERANRRATVRNITPLLQVAAAN